MQHFFPYVACKLLQMTLKRATLKNHMEPCAIVKSISVQICSFHNEGWLQETLVLFVAFFICCVFVLFVLQVLVSTIRSVDNKILNRWLDWKSTILITHRRSYIDVNNKWWWILSVVLHWFCHRNYLHQMVSRTYQYYVYLWSTIVILR